MGRRASPPGWTCEDARPSHVWLLRLITHNYFRTIS
jgi:hypothetical protein